MNTIIENFLEQVGPYGWDDGLLKDIIYLQYEANVALPKGKSYYNTNNGFYWQLITTKG